MSFKYGVKGWSSSERVKTGTVIRWCMQDEVNQEESEQDEELDRMQEEYEK